MTEFMDDVELERQYQDYKSQYEAWRETNKHHPDKVAFQQYEQQWRAWEAQVEQRRVEIRKAKQASRTTTAVPQVQTLPLQLAVGTPSTTGSGTSVVGAQTRQKPISQIGIPAVSTTVVSASKLSKRSSSKTRRPVPSAVGQAAARPPHGVRKAQPPPAAVFHRGPVVPAATTQPAMAAAQPHAVAALMQQVVAAAGGGGTDLMSMMMMNPMMSSSTVTHTNPDLMQQFANLVNVLTSSGGKKEKKKKKRKKKSKPKDPPEELVDSADIMQMYEEFVNTGTAKGVEMGSMSEMLGTMMGQPASTTTVPTAASNNDLNDNQAEDDDHVDRKRSGHLPIINSLGPALSPLETSGMPSTADVIEQHDSFGNRINPVSKPPSVLPKNGWHGRASRSGGAQPPVSHATPPVVLRQPPNGFAQFLPTRVHHFVSTAPMHVPPPAYTAPGCPAPGPPGTYELEKPPVIDLTEDEEGEIRQNGFQQERYCQSWQHSNFRDRNSDILKSKPAWPKMCPTSRPKALFAELFDDPCSHVLEVETEPEIITAVENEPIPVFDSRKSSDDPQNDHVSSEAYQENPNSIRSEMPSNFTSRERFDSDSFNQNLNRDRQYYDYDQSAEENHRRQGIDRRRSRSPLSMDYIHGQTVHGSMSDGMFENGPDRGSFGVGHNPNSGNRMVGISDGHDKSLMSHQDYDELRECRLDGNPDNPPGLDPKSADSPGTPPELQLLYPHEDDSDFRGSLLAPKVPSGTAFPAASFGRSGIPRQDGFRPFGPRLAPRHPRMNFQRGNIS